MWEKTLNKLKLFSGQNTNAHGKCTVVTSGQKLFLDWSNKIPSLTFQECITVQRASQNLLF